MNFEVKFHEFVTILLSLVVSFQSFPEVSEWIISILKVVDVHNGMAQVLVAASTAFFAWWIPSRYRLNELRGAALEGLYSFNEAVIYHGALLEGAVASAERVLEAYYSENKVHNNLRLGLRPDVGGVPFKLIYVLPLMLPDVENIITKIKNPGKVHDLVMAYMRIKQHMEQFDLISAERGEKLKHLNQDISNGVSPEQFKKDFREIFNLTKGLALSIEAIIDHALFGLEKINLLSQEEKKYFIKISRETITVCTLEQNSIHDSLRLELRSIIDGVEEFNPRFLYLAPQTERVDTL